jgi:hypothetical protein
MTEPTKTCSPAFQKTPGAFTWGVDRVGPGTAYLIRVRFGNCFNSSQSAVPNGACQPILDIWLLRLEAKGIEVLCRILEVHRSALS